MSDYFINKSKKILSKMHSYYQEFPKNNNNYTINQSNCTLNNNNSIFIKIPINIEYKENKSENKDKFIYLNSPCINNINDENDINYQNIKIDLNNINLYKYNCHEELFASKTKVYNRYKNINLKKYHPLHEYQEHDIL